MKKRPKFKQLYRQICQYKPCGAVFFSKYKKTKFCSGNCSTLNAYYNRKKILENNQSKI